MKRTEWIVYSDQLPNLGAHVLGATLESLGEDDAVRNLSEAILSLKHQRDMNLSKYGRFMTHGQVLMANIFCKS
jgi:hypothetical protein